MKALLAGLAATLLLCSIAGAADGESGGISITVSAGDEPGGTAPAIQLLGMIALFSIAPAALIMLTSFTRIVVVLSFLRRAIGTQTMPPNQLIIGLALFLTFFIMAPTWGKVSEVALQPYLAGELDQAAAIKAGTEPLRSFMLSQTREKDLGLFVQLSHAEPPKTPDEIPTVALIPAFVISELRTAFQMGFVLFIPFLIIDMVVASVLMSMGMLMLPPIMISLPFKIVLFVMVDGWYLVVRSLAVSFQ